MAAAMEAHPESGDVYNQANFALTWMFEAEACRAPVAKHAAHLVQHLSTQ
eukprot:COSAG01_NODE_3642_length_5836_cov_6.885132_3_plen_50_part_00